MSESDSDLAFESADEDTAEHDTRTKECLSETVKELQITSDTVLLSHKPTAATELACSSKVLNEKNNESDNMADKKKTSENFIDENSVNIQSSENRDMEETNLDVSSLLLSDLSNEYEKSKVEVQRVPLRLEKKMQQKIKSSKSVSKPNICEKSNSSAESTETITSGNNEEKSYSWGFSSWGTSLLSTAASSVSTFSNQVSQGIGTVFETVESTLGAPSPEDLASTLEEKRTKDSASVNTETECKEDEAAGLGMLPDVSSWTRVLESTGSKVIMGGLDTLEFIGKKTINILTEGDPGLRSKRHVFSDGANLSQILREAKEKAENQDENDSQNNDVVNYSQVFDDQQGLVHLEALEMLSKQAHAKFQRLMIRQSNKAEIKKRLEEIKSICENIPSFDEPVEYEEFEDFESVFKKHILELNLPLNVDNIIKTQRKLRENVSKYENTSDEPYTSPGEIFRSSICSLAELSARCIETFHKVAELVLVQPKLGINEEQCATNLTGLTTVMCIEVNNLASRYHKCLESSAEHFPNYTDSKNSNVTALVTNLYVEASNSNKYIQDAFQMLVPVLQVGLLESLTE